MALGLVVLVAVAALGAGSASGAGSKKLVEGTVYDTTCATACTPECPPPPHCGPITQAKKAAVICAQAKPAIVCPLYKTVVCIQAPCPGPAVYPVYSGEGAIVNVRRVGAAAVIAALPVVEGHFKVRLGPGQYILHPVLPEEQCWTKEWWRVEVTRRQRGPIPVSLDVANSCVAHPDATTAK